MKKICFIALMLLFASSLLLKAQLNTIVDFNGSNGSNPVGSLVLSNYFLYGATTEKGAHDGGVLFKINVNDLSYQKITDLDGTFGRHPSGSVLISEDVIYGLTTCGAAYDTGGTIYKIRIDGSYPAKLHSFLNSAPVNGLYPTGSLAISGKMLYGTTNEGGTNSDGTIFKIDSLGNGFAKIHDFNGTQGKNPIGSMLIQGDTLFGLTRGGGSSDTAGIIFRVQTDGSNFKVLYDFSDATKYGCHPISLVMSGDTLFGMTSYGGVKDTIGIDSAACVFRIKTNGTDMKKLCNLETNNMFGIFSGSLALSSDYKDCNLLYGLVSGVIDGAYSYSDKIFSIKRDGTDYSVICKLQYQYSYSSGLVLGDNHTFYGTAYNKIYKYHPMLYNPGICMVLYDSATEKNKIVWEKPVTNDIRAYKIYKEVKSNQYKCFDSIPFSRMSVCIDSASNPGSYANKYKISLVDTFGIETALSPYHKPLHIIVNSGNISWYSDNYIDESGKITTDMYYVYGGKTKNTMVIIDSIPGTVQSYTDTKYKGGVMYYQLAIPVAHPCLPTGIIKSGAGSIAQAFSNIIQIGGIGLNPDVQEQISVYPNPAAGSFNVDLKSAGTVEIQLVNEQGIVVWSKSYMDNTGSINVQVPGIAKGLYNLVVKSNENIYSQKMIIE